MSHLRRRLQRRRYDWLGLNRRAASPNIVGLHAYALVSYDDSTQILTLYNPWGFLVTIAWNDVAASFSSVQGVNA